MSTQNDAHDQEVRRIAEILANIEFPNWALAKLDVSNSCRDAWNITVDRNISKARAMVAETVKELIAWMDNYAWTEEGKNEYLMKRGLIPSPSKTGE
jgi:hypothetical protein